MRRNASQPYTPKEVLDISSLFKRLTVKLVLKISKRLGLWRVPYKFAATSSEQMNDIDKCYWIHKSRCPVERPESSLNLEHLFIKYDPIELNHDITRVSTLTMSAAGDLLHTKGMEDSKGALFKNVSNILFSSDISFANLESSITTQALIEEVIGDQGPPIECCSDEQFSVLKGHAGKQFTVLNTANNHCFDMSFEGISTTHEVLKKEGIIAVGTNTAEQTYAKGIIVERNGIRVGFVSATFGINGQDIKAEERYFVHQEQLHSRSKKLDLSLLKRQIDDCKKQECDFVVASLHWGYEFELYPRQHQMDIAEELIEHGVDYIWGHHPHVIQPIQYYKTKRNPNRIAVIAYSLGSLAWGFDAPHIALSVIMQLSLIKVKVPEGHFTYIKEVHNHPVFRNSIIEDGKQKVVVEQLHGYISEKRSDLPKGYIEKLEYYAKLVLGDYTKPITLTEIENI